MALFEPDARLQQAFVILAWLVGGLVLLGYLLLPWWAYIHSRILAQPTVEMIDWKLYPLPVRFRERLERDGEQLQAAGFHLEYAYLSQVTSGAGETVGFAFFHPELRISAAVCGQLVGGAQGFVVADMFTILATRFQLAEPVILQSNNQDAVVDLDLGPPYRAFGFPHVSDVSRLLQLHQCLEKRDFPESPRSSEGHEEPLEEIRRAMERRYQEIIEHWVTGGFIERVANEVNYRHKASTLYQACWKKWPPFGPFFKWLRYRESKRFERELLRTAT